MGTSKSWKECRPSWSCSIMNLTIQVARPFAETKEMKGRKLLCHDNDVFGTGSQFANWAYPDSYRILPPNVRTVDTTTWSETLRGTRSVIAEALNMKEELTFSKSSKSIHLGNASSEGRRTLREVPSRRDIWATRTFCKTWTLRCNQTILTKTPVRPFKGMTHFRKTTTGPIRVQFTTRPELNLN